MKNEEAKSEFQEHDYTQQIVIIQRLLTGGIEKIPTAVYQFPG